ncbi:CD276 antigen-like [Archocentrus centrarchus]|uniref:CD276 antigen-like n=1 Tax=Archocentrus centrarchus TaxID=63155 RepID=UPI0011EA4A97|nr:CD276 antigen-like [Archocentrus centrarchus]
MIVWDTTRARDVNTTAGDSAILRCSVDKNVAQRGTLRFYWQDDQNSVLYSFYEGRTITDHVSDVYLQRVSAFPQDIITGNISIVIKNLTLDDNGRTLWAFAAVLDGSGTMRYHLENTQMCQTTLHVAVPYHTPTLEVDTETMSAACSIQGGFPAPEIQWLLRHNTSHQSVESRSVHTTMLQNSHSRLFSSHSTLRIPAGAPEAVSCLSHNPTLNRTVNATHTFNKGAAVRSSPGGLIAAAVALLTALQRL